MIINELCNSNKNFRERNIRMKAITIKKEIMIIAQIKARKHSM